MRVNIFVGRGSTYDNAIDNLMRQFRNSGNHNPVKVTYINIVWRDYENFNVGYEVQLTGIAEVSEWI